MSAALHYRATLAYDGTAYYGSQRQAEGIQTVQAAVERAIAKVTQQAVTIIAAGRTDAGVHATGQVITFTVAWRHGDDKLLRAINANLPDDIALQDLQQQPGFHPRYDARARRYCYSVVQAAQRQPLLSRSAWHVTQPLDLHLMEQAAALMVGKHDFAAFGTPPQGDNTVREVFVSEWTWQAQPYGALYQYTVEANAFLYHMVRRMVGLQVEVGRKRLSLDAFAEIFFSADLSQARALAPPQGLVLTHVRYGDDGGDNERTNE